MAPYIIGGIVAIIVIGVIAYHVARFMKGNLKLQLSSNAYGSGQTIDGRVTLEAKRPIRGMLRASLVGRERQRRRGSSSSSSNHEWVEVFLEDEGWRPVDPTFGESRAGPNRLKMATGTSQPESLLQMGLAAASALNGLRVSVIAHEVTP